MIVEESTTVAYKTLCTIEADWFEVFQDETTWVTKKGIAGEISSNIHWIVFIYADILKKINHD